MGINEGEFDFPVELTFDPSGYLYVVDAHSKLTDHNYDRIQVFTKDGEFVMTWGKTGAAEDGDFQYPQSISIDTSCYVYVGDTTSDCVMKFTSTGTFIKKWGDSGSGDGELKWPFGISISSNGWICC